MSQKLARKDINLLDVYQVKKEPSKYTPIIKFISLPLIAAIVFVGIFGFNQYRIKVVKEEQLAAETETQKINDEIANDPRTQTYAKYMANLSAFVKLSTLYTNIQSYPQLSLDTFDQIVLAADMNVDVTSFSYVRESQVITLTTESRYANDTENFVRRLKTSGAFASVDYSGYSMVEKSNETQTTQPQTDENPTTDETQKLLEQLLNIQNNNSNNTKTQTTEIYTSTVLCVLK